MRQTPSSINANQRYMDYTRHCVWTCAPTTSITPIQDKQD